MDVDAHLVHLGDAIFGRDRELGDMKLAHVGSERVPRSSALDGVAESSGGDVVMDVDYRHRVV